MTDASYERHLETVAGQWRDALSSHGYDAAVIAVAADYTDKPAEAAATLRGFVRHIEALAPMLEAVGERADAHEPVGSVADVERASGATVSRRAG